MCRKATCFPNVRATLSAPARGWRELSMKIGIAGAGPAGLLFACLAKTRRPKLDVFVVEQNASDATFGFGVVFSHGALEFLARDAPALHEALAGQLETW